MGQRKAVMVGFIGKNRKKSTGYEPVEFENFLIPLAFLTDQYYIQDRSFNNRSGYGTESDITARRSASGV